MKILLVEPDEYYHHEFRQRMPGGTDFELAFARSLAQAEVLAQNFQPDMVVAELLLPDGPSFDWLFQQSRRKRPVVVFSAQAHVEDIEHTLGLGVAGYFLKGQDTVRDVYQLLLALTH